MELDADQQRAVETLTDPNIPITVMTGGPGVGKTYTLNAVVNRLPGHVVLCSPTGKAAKRLSEATGREAKTIHAILKGGTDGNFQHGEGNPLDADVVVVDEASMVETLIMAALVAALRPGARLLLVGDANQLPPVGAGQPFTDIIRSEKIPVARLTIIHRQKGDSWVLDNAYRIINDGKPVGLRPSTKDTHDFTMLEVPSEEITAAAVDVILADPKAVVLTPQWAVGAGVNRINIAAQIAVLGEVRPGEKVISLINEITCRKGDRVMIIRNMRAIPEDGEEEVYLPNGATGICREVLGDYRGEFEFEGRTFIFGGDQLKMNLAYAMTIHKSQGSGWDHVVFIADPAHKNMMEKSGRQLVYTAVTRVQERLTVIGSATTFEDAARGPMTNLRQTYLRQFYPA